MGDVVGVVAVWVVRVGGSESVPVTRQPSSGKREAPLSRLFFSLSHQGWGELGLDFTIPQAWYGKSTFLPRV
jgi:hypothetical protein